LCDILDCQPGDLIEPYPQGPTRARPSGQAPAGQPRPRRARILPNPRT